MFLPNHSEMVILVEEDWERPYNYCMVIVTKRLKYTDQTGVEEPFITYVDEKDKSWKINMEQCTVYRKEDGKYNIKGTVYATEANDSGIELEYIRPSRSGASLEFNDRGVFRPLSHGPLV